METGSFVAGLFILISHVNIGNIVNNLAVGFTEYFYLFMEHVGEQDGISFDVKEA